MSLAAGCLIPQPCNIKNIVIQQTCTEPRKIAYYLKMQYDKDAFYQRIFASEGGQGQISLTFIVATGFEHGNLGQ